MLNTPKISALVITKNEEHNIPSLLENLSFADEIIIVDSFSTDKTEELSIKNEKVRFYKNPFQNFASQRNVALKYASFPWILFLDADERLTPELKEEVLQTIQNPKADSYFFYRTFFFEGKPMHYTGLQSDKNIRLFKNGIGEYTGLVHEKLSNTGKTAALKNKLIHYSFIDKESYKEKLAHYGRLKGKEKHEKGVKYNAIKQIGHTAFTFFNKYIMRFGFLDGKKGITVSYLMAYSVWVRYDEMKILQNK